MMKRVFDQLWNDDDGQLIAMELLFVATLLVLGIIVGLSGLRVAINAELTELGNAILALSQGYSFAGETGCCASTDGSQAIDTPSLLTPPTCTPPAIPSVIDVIPCS